MIRFRVKYIIKTQESLRNIEETNQKSNPEREVSELQYYKDFIIFKKRFMNQEYCNLG